MGRIQVKRAALARAGVFAGGGMIAAGVWLAAGMAVGLIVGGVGLAAYCLFLADVEAPGGGGEGRR